MKKAVGFSATLLCALSAQAAQAPSSSATPYLVPTGAAEFTAILTAGDAVKKSHKGNEIYRMVGDADGLGAYDNGDGTFTVLANHELTPSEGIARDHGGSAGSFVSAWQVRKSDLKVLRGGDLIQTVMVWDASAGTWVPSTNAVFNRFCSADLPKPSALFNSKTGLGFSDGRLYFNGEETAGGRAFAHVASGREHGTTYQLPALGNIAFENVVLSPYEQDKTVAIAMDDTSGSGGTPAGRVVVYVGTKTDEGNPVEMAGLAGGALKAIAVDGVTAESRDNGIPAGTRFSLVAPGSTTMTKFLRPEDGAWDTVDPSRFYFATTDRFDSIKDGTGTQKGRSRIWRLTFDDIESPEAGGTIEMMLDGTEAGNMFDNLTVDGDGKLIVLEDVGNNAHNGKVWQYDPVADTLTLVGKHDPARFGDIGVPAAAGFTQDEETSGVIEITDLLSGTPGYETSGFRYFLLDDQAHADFGDAEIVEKGQLLMLKVPR